MNDVLAKVGLTREQMSSALRKSVLPSREDVVTASAISLKGRQGRRGLPDNIVKAMYDDYLRMKSLSAVGAKYGRSRQSVYELFASRRLKCYARNWGVRINYGGLVYTLKADGYFRATTGERRALHHQMWLDRGNIIPPGYQVSFADGDPTNFAKENLFCASLVEVTLYHQQRLGKVKYPTAEEKRRRKCEIAKACYQRKRLKFLAKGLTTTGKVRQRHPNFLNPAEASIPDYVERVEAVRRTHVRQQVLANYHKRAERLTAQGLNTRGQPRVYRVRGKSDLQKSYDQFRSGINTFGASWDIPQTTQGI